MNGFSKISSMALMAGLCLGAFPTRADLEVSADVRIHAVAEFEAPLTPHGSWITVGTYGRCWRPASVAVEWRPYCDGYWEWTDCGWYWVSDEPWGWACYHYGYWTLEPAYGWIWVPGIEWAPAWVSWRFGGGYCGWAPLAPRGVVIAPAAFVFVEERRFRERQRPTTVIVNNTTIINKTTVINNIKREERQIAGVGRQRVVVNEGPGAANIEKATGKKLSPQPIHEVAQKTPIPREAIRSARSERPGEPGQSRSTTPPAAPETRTAQPQPRTVQPDRNAVAPETRSPETRTSPPEIRTPAPEKKRPLPEARQVFPETTTPQPETRTVPPTARTVPPETRTAPPQVRTAPPETRTLPGERSQVRDKENAAPPAVRSPHNSPRETERRGAVGRAWGMGRERN